MPIGSLAAQVAAWKRWPGANPPGPLGGGPLSVTFGSGTDLRIRTQIALGADLSASPGTWLWEDISAYVRYEAGITVTTGRRDQASQVDTARGSITLDNRDGRFCRRNKTGPYYGLLSRNTPIWVTVDPGSGQYDLMQLFVNEWPARWDKSENDAWVTITCGGIMRRLSKGSVVLDPIVEATSSTTTTETPGNVMAYWPCTDASGSTTAASAVAGVPAMTTEGTVDFGVVDPGSGLALLPDFSDGGRLIGTIPAGAVVDQWTIECRAKAASSATANEFLLTVACPGSATARSWSVIYQTGSTIDVNYYTPGGAGTTAFSVATSGFDGTFHTVQLRCAQSGGNVNVSLYIDAVLRGSASVAVTLARPDKIYVSDRYGDNLLSAGQVKVYESATPVGSSTTTTTTTATIANNFAGELAHERIVRVCAQAGIPVLCLASTSVPMGVAQSNTLMDQLRECEAADGGVLYETDWGLGYQSLTERWNAPAALALNFDSKHIGEPPEPADDDRSYRNQWTVTRTGGSSATARLADDVIAAEGLYDDSTTVNVTGDGGLYAQAGWRLRRDGQVDDDRWPNLVLRLHRTPDLIPTWVALPYGVRTQVTNLPTAAGPDRIIDAMIEGVTQRVDVKTWTVTLNTAPASVYDVQVLANSASDTYALVGLTDHDSCALNAAVDAVTTSWAVNTTPLADTTMAAGPRVLRFGIEEIRVTNVVGVANPQTWTVVRGVNGLPTAHLAGAAGELTMPLIPVLP